MPLAAGCVDVFVLAHHQSVVAQALPHRLKRAVLRAAPARRARNVNTVWLEVEEKLGGSVVSPAARCSPLGMCTPVGSVRRIALTYR